jgi:hypothetical protein
MAKCPSTKGPWRCDDCGQEWPRDPALEVACPKCGAAVGKWCYDDRPSGHRAKFGVWVHSERDQRALDEGIITRCPKAKKAPLGKHYYEDGEPYPDQQKPKQEPKPEKAKPTPAIVQEVMAI